MSKNAGKPNQKTRGERAYEASVAHDEDRERRRWLMYAMIEYAEGKDTADARLVGEALAKVNDSKRRSDLVGDPLRLLPVHRRIKQQEEKAAAKRKKKGEGPTKPNDGLRETTVVHELGADKVKYRGHQFRGLKDYQKAAVLKFMADWANAYEKDLAGATWDPKVDGGRNAHTVHLKKLEAQDRLRRLEIKIGSDSYEVLKAYAVERIGADEMAKAGGMRTTTATDQIQKVIEGVAVFYGIRNAPTRDKILDGIDRIRIQRAEEIIQEAGRDLARGRQATSAGMSTSS